MRFNGGNHTFPTAQAREKSGAYASKGLSSTLTRLQLCMVTTLVYGVYTLECTAWEAEGGACALQSISQSSMAPGTLQTASVGDNQPGVTNLSTGAANYDTSIQKLTIPGINFNLSCPTGLRVSWTSGRPTAQPQQPVNGQQGE